MYNTGRLKSTLHPDARRVLFDAALPDQIKSDLPHMARIDCAHVTMLASQGLIDRNRARCLLQEILALRDSEFAPLHASTAPRGLFLLYENYLIGQLGPETGGLLQTARSRNDLNATVFKLRTRSAWARLLREGLRLQAALLSRAYRYRAVTMPIYTHGQPGMPGTYGHYLAGVASAVSRDLHALEQAGSGLAISPLGAGAAGGTTIPIDTERTAKLLGFDAGPLHSIDSVASRDIAPRLLSAAAIFGVTLSRLAADLFQWSTQEFAFLAIPDWLAGSSSAMPQKRNPFLLEHIQGRSASAAGALTTALMAMHSSPFSNSIASGTDALRPFWTALDDTATAVLLARLMIAGAAPEEAAMCRRAAEGFVTATEIANRLMAAHGLDFRSAHHLIGESISVALENGGSVRDVLRQFDARGLSIGAEAVDAASAARRAQFGGGPGLDSFRRCFDALAADWAGIRARLRVREARWREAATHLDSAVAQLCAGAAMTRFVLETNDRST